MLDVLKIRCHESLWHAVHDRGRRFMKHHQHVMGNTVEFREDNVELWVVSAVEQLLLTSRQLVPTDLSRRWKESRGFFQRLISRLKYYEWCCCRLQDDTLGMIDNKKEARSVGSPESCHCRNSWWHTLKSKLAFKSFLHWVAAWSSLVDWSPDIQWGFGK